MWIEIQKIKISGDSPNYKNNKSKTQTSEKHTNYTAIFCDMQWQFLDDLNKRHELNTKYVAKLYLSKERPA
jgi:hypothetical protein